jgi:hypothetical protein
VLEPGIVRLAAAILRASVQQEFVVAPGLVARPALALTAHWRPKLLREWKIALQSEAERKSAANAKIFLLIDATSHRVFLELVESIKSPLFYFLIGSSAVANNHLVATLTVILLFYIETI